MMYTDIYIMLWAYGSDVGLCFVPPKAVIHSFPDLLSFFYSFFT